MLRESAKLNLKSRRDHLAFLGKYFRVLLQPPAELTDEEVLSLYIFSTIRWLFYSQYFFSAGWREIVARLLVCALHQQRPKV
jgi:hypothetical protein